MNHFSSRNLIFDVPEAQTYEKSTFSQNRSSWTSEVVFKTQAIFKIMPVRVPPGTQMTWKPLAQYIYGAWFLYRSFYVISWKLSFLIPWILWKLSFRLTLHIATSVFAILPDLMWFCHVCCQVLWSALYVPCMLAFRCLTHSSCTYTIPCACGIMFLHIYIYNLYIHPHIHTCT